MTPSNVYYFRVRGTKNQDFFYVHNKFKQGKRIRRGDEQGIDSHYIGVAFYFIFM